jgi:putative two-component system response regulator
MATIESIHECAQNYSALLVEDDVNLRITTSGLMELLFKSVDTGKNGREGLDLFREKRHDIIITDIDMPVMNGVEMIREVIKHDPQQSIVVVSGHDEAYYLIELINMGINHFIPKPFEKETILSVLETVLRYKRLSEIERDYQRQLEHAVALKTRELNESLQTIKELSGEIVLRLTTAAEYRDTDTGAHINRMSEYVDIFARVLDLDDQYTDALKFAAPLHDIGKIGIPDNILLKPAALSEEEWTVMKKHTTIGARILDRSKFGRVNTACSVAMNHHERWDGSGYPRGLQGDAIPLEGRIISICDVYDAIRSRRPYKEPVDHEEACRRIIGGDGRTGPGHFDPRVLAAFREVSDEIERIYSRIADDLS